MMALPVPLRSPLLAALLFSLLHAQETSGVPRFSAFGGPPGPVGGERVKLVDRFDADRNGRLDRDERRKARAWLAEHPVRRGPMGRKRPSGFGRGPGAADRPPPGAAFPPGIRPQSLAGADPGEKRRTVRPEDVATFPGRPFFDPDVVRTVFLDFEGDDWFEEMDAFYHTDVLLPARVTIDGATLEEVGVRFRGNTSYMGARGRRKSFDLQFDFVERGQDLRGLKNLDLLNCNQDPTFMREALHGWLANGFLPAQRVALVRVVCNGEDFGIYAAVEQFDKAFLRAHYGTAKVARFKVLVDFSGNGGLRWLGDEPESYRRNYEIKSKDDPAAWDALIDLCAVLDLTPTEDLERILPQHLAVDDALWFLAIDNALQDDDGYHSRASDYLLYLDSRGRFHPIARDNNEILPARNGRRGRGPGGGPGASLPDSPLAFAGRDDRPLLKRMLEVPRWRERYLANVRAVARDAFLPEVIEARIDAWRRLIAPILDSGAPSSGGLFVFEQGVRELKAAIARRRASLLADPSLSGAWPMASDLEAGASPGPDGSSIVQATCRAGGAAIESATLHFRAGPFGAESLVPMLDDGEHGDGARGDGVYGARLAARASGDLSVWVEVVAAGSGHLSRVPAGGGARPFVLPLALRPRKPGGTR